MDIFYPADVIEVVRQICAFGCWGFGFRCGTWLFDRLVNNWSSFFRELRKKKP